MKRKLLIVALLFIALLGLAGCTPKQSPSKYTVTWQVGEQVFVEEYNYGEMPTYKFGVDKPADAYGTYTFEGWDKEITEVTKNVTYRAIYNKDAVKCTITWVIDGKEFPEVYEYGEKPSYKGETPTKVGSEMINYVFTGWDKEISLVTKDEKITAMFELAYNQYEITFVVDGKEIKEKFYYGTIPALDEKPSKPYDENYSYEFTGWTDSNGTTYTNGLPEVVGAATYTAVFKQVERIFGIKVNKLNLDGSLIDSEVVPTSEIGQKYKVNAPVVSGKVPSQEYVEGIAKVTEEVNIYYSELSTWDGTSKSSSLSGNGTSSSPYLIKSAADLAYVKENASTFEGKYLKMMVSVDVTKSPNFMIVGFNGHFNGNNCCIKGLNISNNAEETGFFNSIAENSSVTKLNIYGTVSGAGYVGALVGKALGNITSCNNYATVNATGGNVGGIAGLVTGKYTKFSYNNNYGAINGSLWNTAGVVGLSDIAISYCKNYGNITVQSDASAGVVGTAHQTVSYCENYGTVIGAGTMGGIVYEANGIIMCCNNYGSVSGAWDTAGIASRANKEVSYCNNYGAVNGSETGTHIGGVVAVVGFNGVARVYKCTNEGIVTGKAGVGGIAGQNLGTIYDCVNKGAISGVDAVGGIAGECGCYEEGTYRVLREGIVKECINTGAITGTNVDLTGGVCGLINKFTSTDINALYLENENTGTVSNNKNDYGAIN